MSEVESLSDVQISKLGIPETAGTLPARWEVMNISKPSRRIPARASRAGLLSSVTFSGELNEPSGFLKALHTSRPPTPPGLSLRKYRTPPFSSSSRYVGPSSNADEFNTQPRFTGGSQPKSSLLSRRAETQRSRPPQPPARSLPKNNTWPPAANAGANSPAGLLITLPRFCGGGHGASTVGRRENQRSDEPLPPARSDVKYKLRLSGEMPAC